MSDKVEYDSCNEHYCPIQNPPYCDREHCSTPFLIPRRVAGVLSDAGHCVVNVVRNCNGAGSELENVHTTWSIGCQVTGPV